MLRVCCFCLEYYIYILLIIIYAQLVAFFSCVARLCYFHGILYMHHIYFFFRLLEKRSYVNIFCFFSLSFPKLRKLL